MAKQFLVSLFAVLIAAVCHAENWADWRGPGFAGSFPPGAYPTTWSDDDNVAWKIKLPGKGFSTPIVWGDHIIVTVPIEGKDGVMDFDLSGKARWQKAFGPERPGEHENGSGCNPSPITDGTTIFVYYKSGTLAALDFSGEVLWQKDLQAPFGKDTLYWDVGTSPVLTDKYVIGTVMHGGESGMIAFEKRSGEVAWKTARNYECYEEGDHGYTTPIVLGEGTDQRILTWGGEHVTAHGAVDGKLLWSCAGFNPDGRPNWPTVASPVVVNNTIVVPYGRGRHLTGIRLGGSGDVTDTHRLWTRNRLGAFVPTPAVHDGNVYVLSDDGKVTSVDPLTGETHWENALPKSSGLFYASPIIADGKLYATSEDGIVFVASINGEFTVLSKNVMGEKIIGSPAPLGNHLLLRGETHLFCVGAPAN